MKVLLFGIIAERASATEIQGAATSLHALKHEMETRIPGLAELSYAIAVDRHITTADRPLSGSEEIALLPPFAGG